MLLEAFENCFLLVFLVQLACLELIFISMENVIIFARNSPVLKLKFYVRISLIERFLKLVYYPSYSISLTHQHENHQSGFTVILDSRIRWILLPTYLSKIHNEMFESKTLWGLSCVHTTHRMPFYRMHTRVLHKMEASIINVMFRRDLFFCDLGGING